TIVPADSSRCASSLRTKRWCSASLPRNRGGLNPRTISSAASTRPQNTWHWSKYVYRRNAASLHGGGQYSRRRRAMGQTPDDRRACQGSLGLELTLNRLFP